MNESLSLKFDENKILVLDQTRLPFEEKWIDVTDPQVMEDSIRGLRVRGAPLIAVAASLGLGLFCIKNERQDLRLFWWKRLVESRPTAVNLMNLFEELKVGIIENQKGTDIFSKACQFYHDDIQRSEDMIKNGVEVLEGLKNFLTHCNTGGLATAGRGTALGVIKELYKKNPKTHVFVGETRPLLQGGRLTTWELSKAHVNFSLICDSMAGFLMHQKKVDAVVVGADRIARNGDSANKIGTYSLAVLCHHHKIPFYIVAPLTTVDKNLVSGDLIPIEFRSKEEVLGFTHPDRSVSWVDPNTKVFNPAFDWVPSSLIQGWITDEGVFTQKDIKHGIFSRV